MAFLSQMLKVPKERKLGPAKPAISAPFLSPITLPEFPENSREFFIYLVVESVIPWPGSVCAQSAPTSMGTSIPTSRTCTSLSDLKRTQ